MKGELVIVAVGDIRSGQEDPVAMFMHTASVLRKADLTIGNLEGPACDRGQPIPGKVEQGSRHLRSVPHVVPALASVGFDAVGLANNHAMDYSADGLLQTMELLEKAGIAHAGGGRNLADARRPSILERDGTKVALLSYTSVFPIAGFAATSNTAGIATVRAVPSFRPSPRVFYEPGSPMITMTAADPMEAQRMAEDIREAKRVADIVVLFMHWGVAGGYGRIVDYQKELGRLAIESGADLIIGHHAHQLLGMEVYKGKVITYSVGDFAFDLWISYFGSESILVKAYVREKAIQKVTFLPVTLDAKRCPHILKMPEGMDVVRKLEKMSEEFSLVLTPEGDEVVIRGTKD
ncbi:MAG: CapA family protein [Betaproteobacteria bacterium]|nr:CapA family protein [Betaproteobacteria bacterium]